MNKVTWSNAFKTCLKLHPAAYPVSLTTSQKSSLIEAAFKIAQGSWLMIKS